MTRENPRLPARVRPQKKTPAPLPPMQIEQMYPLHPLQPVAPRKERPVHLWLTISGAIVVVASMIGLLNIRAFESEIVVGESLPNSLSEVLIFSSMTTSFFLTVSLALFIANFLIGKRGMCYRLISTCAFAIAAGSHFLLLLEIGKL